MPSGEIPTLIAVLMGVMGWLFGFCTGRAFDRAINVILREELNGHPDQDPLAVARAAGVVSDE